MATLDIDDIHSDSNKVKLPKLGFVKFAKSREVEGRILNATVRREPTGKHFVSILVKTEMKEWPKTNSSEKNLPSSSSQ